MAKHATSQTRDRSVRLHILDDTPPAAVESSTPHTLTTLEELFETISLVTGLDVCIYPPPRQNAVSNIQEMPLAYLRHRSDFCLAAKRTRDGRGCRKHDSFMTNARAAEIGHPFVQTCHRGVAEVIIPIFSGEEHLGTVFLGQVVTPQIESRGFDAIWEVAKPQVLSRDKLRQGFEKLPRMSEEQLLRIGLLADAALQGLADQLSTDAFATQVRLHGSPQVRRAVDILEQERCWDTPAQEMARRVHLSAAHFSRLFHRVMGRTYSQYVNRQRLGEAGNLLHHSDMSIAQIAMHCGFTRQNYFTRRFRDAFGVTPTQFRQRRQAGADNPHTDDHARGSDGGDRVDPDDPGR